MFALVLLETAVELDSIFIHAVIYAVLGIIIIYLLLQKSYKPKAPVVLTASEIQECIDSWNPKPLVFDVSEEDAFDISSIQVTQKVNGNFLVINGEEKINCSSGNFLGLSHSNKQIEEASTSALRKYGCGSCGPRQFYGTIDVHILFEERMAKFLNTECAILYSSGFATATSVISLFCTRLDYVICDEGVKQSIQMGNYLSRSNVKYFRHNDMGHARELMQSIRKGLTEKQKSKIRCFVIVEGVYQLRGTICPLPEIIEIAKENKFRIILDDSVALGCLGKTGRGTVEHFNLDINDIDIYIADISLGLSSLGGVCAGSYHMCNFQKINSSGYVFSASNPPFLASTAIESLNEIDRKPEIVSALQNNSSRLRKLLNDIDELDISGYDLSPIIIVRLVERLRTHNKFEDSKTLQAIVDYAMENGVAITRIIFHKNHRFAPDPCIKIAVMATHTAEQLDTIAHVVRSAVTSVLSH